MIRFIVMLTSFLYITNISFSQSSAQYTNNIYEYVQKMDASIHDRFKDTLILRRVETGILDNYDDGLAIECKREFYSGRRYSIIAFTDKRVTDMKLICYKKNASTSKWEELKTVNENRSSESSLIGDYEIYTVDVDDDASYKFKIFAANNSNTARYGMMIWSKATSTSTSSSSGSSSSTTGAKSFSVDNYSVAEYDNAKDKYGDFGPSKDYNCLFQINAAETVISLKDDDGIGRYYIDSKNTDDARWIIYYVSSTKGVKYKFMFPGGDGAYIRIVKNDGSVTHPSLTDYHIKSKWTD